MFSSEIASIIPDGQGGKLIVLGCDDDKDAAFREVVELARNIEDFTQKDKTTSQRGAGRNPAEVPEDLVQWIRHADHRKDKE